MSREGMIPRNITFSVIIILLTFLSSCGLYTYAYLEAPGVSTMVGSGNAEIYNRSDYDPDVFRGYELYYKFYTDSTERISNDKTIFATSEPEPSDLTAVGYSRINTVLSADDSTSYPMVPVDYSDRDTAFTLTVNFDQLSSGVVPYVSYSGYSDVFLRRTASEYNSLSKDYEYKSFRPVDYDTGDSDWSPGETELSLYVFAYGKDDNVYKIYSKPVWLGYINITTD